MSRKSNYHILFLFIYLPIYFGLTKLNYFWYFILFKKKNQINIYLVVSKFINRNFKTMIVATSEIKGEKKYCFERKFKLWKPQTRSFTMRKNDMRFRIGTSIRIPSCKLTTQNNQWILSCGVRFKCFSIFTTN